MREYTDSDFDTINSWALSHGFELYKEALSPLGLIDDNIYCSIYLGVGCKCMFVDNFIANPGANPIQIKNGIQEIERQIRNMLTNSEGIWTVRITAIDSLAPILERLGGIVDPQEYKQVFFVV